MDVYVSEQKKWIENEKYEKSINERSVKRGKYLKKKHAFYRKIKRIDYDYE